MENEKKTTIFVATANDANNKLTTYTAAKPNNNFAKPVNRNKKNNNRNVNTDKNALSVFAKEEKETTLNITTQSKPHKKNLGGKLNVVFLGGVGEIGKNMTALEYGNDIIIIDSGSTFPNDEMPGIDLVVPDLTYLHQNRSKIRGIVITHGHEDHIGGLPYILNEFDLPVFGSRLAMSLVENKLREFPKIKAKLNNVQNGTEIQLGCFKIEFIHVNHSIAGSFALNITTPIGNVFHTGDFKIDFTPIGSDVINLPRIAEIGKKGVLLMLAESTNVERKGYSMSESKVGLALDDLFAKYNDKRLFVATFASNIYRLQQILSLAEKYGRRVVFTGRSMINVTETAYKIGELKFNRNIILDIEKANKFPDKELLFVTTGSQGEPMSALTRMAAGDFPKIQLGEHDAIIISASPIPGNEKSVNNVINKLYQLGCTVLYNELYDIHASGHACQEELKIIHDLVKPKFFIPVHGEYRHMKHHKDLAMEMGMPERNILIAHIGSKVEVSKELIKENCTVIAGQRLVDGLGLGDIESIVLRDRKQLSEDGLCVVVVGMSSLTGEITSGPDIISRGLIYANEVDKLISEVKDVVTDTFSDMNLKQLDLSLMKNNVRKNVANYFYKKTKRRPVILTVILEVN